MDRLPHSDLLPDTVVHEQTKQNADLDETVQYIAEPGSSSSRSASAPTPDAEGHRTAPTDPAVFSFPTLEPDGSVENIRATSTRRHPPTPPAALSSLAAKTNMTSNNDDMSDSTTSFADSQYDMIDDLSEVSNDDHDTASLASTSHAGSDGAVTPDDAGSVMGEEPEEIMLENLEDSMRRPTLTPDTANIIRDRQIGDRGMLDSYLSEDVDTPRQSTLYSPPQSTSPQSLRRVLPKTPDDHQSFPLTYKSKHAEAGYAQSQVLFISDRHVPQVTKDAICSKIASSLAGKEDTSACRIRQLPLTPTGISLSSATVYRDGNFDVVVQHCVGTEQLPVAENHSPSWTIHLLDTDGEHSSVYVVGGKLKRDSAKPTFPTPSLAILYSDVDQTVEWLETARVAMQKLDVPVLELSDDVHKPGWTCGGYRDDVQAFLMMNSSADVHTHLSILRRREYAGLSTLVNSEPRSVLAKKKSEKIPIKSWDWQSNKVRWLLRCLSLALLFLPFMNVIVPMFAANPVVETALRRDALASMLIQSTNSTSAANTFNIEHLLPQPTATSTNMFGITKYSIQNRARYQGVSPGDFVISLPKSTSIRYLQYPVLKSPPHVARVDGQPLACNYTKLIDGIYHIAINPSDAYGMIAVNMTTSKPSMNHYFTHHFGNRLFHRQTYSTDVSKAVNKDLAVARKRATSLKENLQTELSAGAAATKNVTTELALRMTRSLQVFAHTAVSAGNTTASAIRKDLISLGNSALATISYTKKALLPTKDTVVDPLRTSRQRALRLQQRLQDGGKEVSIWVNSLFGAKSAKQEIKKGKVVRQRSHAEWQGYWDDMARKVMAEADWEMRE